MSGRHSATTPDLVPDVEIEVSRGAARERRIGKGLRPGPAHRAQAPARPVMGGQVVYSIEADSRVADQLGPALARLGGAR